MKESRGFFFRRTQQFFTFCTCPMHWRNETDDRTRRREKNRRKMRSYAQGVSCRGMGRILRIRRTSFILVLLDMHISRSRRIDPSTPSSLSAHSEIRFGAAGLSDRRATPGDSRGSNKGSHPGERICSRYILAISQTRRQPTTRRRRRRNRRSAAISANSRSLSFSLSLSISLSLSLPLLSSLFLFLSFFSAGQPFSRS